jgi:GNAT superfamily N-acetyltransferase
LEADRIRYRVATSADVPAIAACRLPESTDERMAAYFDGHHHPQQAQQPRIGFVAEEDDRVVGYIAGHLTTRHGCRGEVQYLFVMPAYRRRGVATTLLRLLARWFEREGAVRVCVCVDAESPAAVPFYERAGASPIKTYWYGWDDIGVVCR